MAVIKREQPKDPNAFPNSQIGVLLREARNRLGDDLQSVSEGLRIRAVYLQAIEEGRFGDLPGTTYALGFVRSYADYLGLDGEEVVRRFKSEVADDLAGPTELVFPSPVSEGRIPGMSVMLVGLLLAAAAYGGWYYLSSREPKIAEMVTPAPESIDPAAGSAAGVGPESRPGPPARAVPEAATSAAPTPPPPPQPEPEPTPAPIVASPAPPPAAAASPTEVPAVPEDIPTAFAGRVYGQANADSRITLRAIDDSWIEVRDGNGDLLQARLLAKGDAYLVPNRPALSMVTGNAGGLEVLVDGKAAPRLGEKGAVRRDVALDADALMAGGPIR